MEKIDDILIDANKLKSSNIQKRYVDDILKDILIDINKNLRSAQRDGECYIITELPIVFDIPNTKNSDSQRMVWARTIDILKSKGFYVKINYSNNKCLLKISWLDREQSNNIIRETKILKESSENF